MAKKITDQAKDHGGLTSCSWVLAAARETTDCNDSDAIEECNFPNICMMPAFLDGSVAFVSSPMHSKSTSLPKSQTAVWPITHQREGPQPVQITDWCWANWKAKDGSTACPNHGQKKRPITHQREGPQERTLSWVTNRAAIKGKHCICRQNLVAIIPFPSYKMRLNESFRLTLTLVARKTDGFLQMRLTKGAQRRAPMPKSKKLLPCLVATAEHKCPRC